MRALAPALQVTKGAQWWALRQGDGRRTGRGSLRNVLVVCQLAAHGRQSAIWRAFGLQPHRVGTFKLSKDPQFVEKDGIYPCFEFFDIDPKTGDGRPINGARERASDAA